MCLNFKMGSSRRILLYSEIPWHDDDEEDQVRKIKWIQSVNSSSRKHLPPTVHTHYKLCDEYLKERTSDF